VSLLLSPNAFYGQQDKVLSMDNASYTFWGTWSLWHLFRH